ncbi:MAG: DUF262 domain-containing protein [Bacteroidales bacterium]|nr:DUF262 domain-containing protein [Bacteroidales bacterium]
MKKNAIITLRQFLDKQKFFIIPNYQRGYIWGKSRDSGKNSVEYVLESIQNSLDNNTVLFMQGITVTENENEIILIDGQQRTTFLYLLLTCLGYQGDINLDYPVRSESDRFLKSLRGHTNEELIKMCADNPQEEFQDIYYFKKTVRLVLKKASGWDIDKILDKVQFLYITIPEDKASLVFSMMNGSKADMKTEEIIKAEMLRLVSAENTFSFNNISSNELLESLFHKVKEVESVHWEQNLLRSKYAREWDKWLYWWNQPEVATYYHTEKSVMGLLVKTYLKSKGGKIGKEGKYFEAFRDKLLRGDNNEKLAKNVFYDLRHLQKKFEDVYNSISDSKKLHNKIGAILTLHGKEDRERFVEWYFASNEEKDIEGYFKLVFLCLSYTIIVENKSEAIENAKGEMYKSLCSNNLYNEDNSYAFMQLLRRNIEEDSKLGRKFDFSIWKERSLEHIYPKSKFYKIETTIDGGKRYIRGDGAEIEEKDTRDLINEADFKENGNEHCIGNLVLLYKNENSGFGAKSFDDKKSIYFNVDSEKPFRSRHLLHTISVFAKKEWGVNEIVENKTNFINEIKEYYGIQ